MSDALQWNGQGPVIGIDAAPAPAAGEVRLQVRETLFVRLPAPLACASWGVVTETGPGVDLTIGSPVVVHTPRAQSSLTVPAGHCMTLDGNMTSDGTTPAIERFLRSGVAEALHALGRARLDLGWTAVVTGADLRAEILLNLARFAGARHVINVRDAEAPAPMSPVDNSFTGAPSAYLHNLTTTLAETPGPVVALDCTSRAQTIQALLAAVPSRSHVVLLGGRESGAGSVNFYQDVHKKNIWIMGSTAADVTPDELQRAKSLLELGRVDLTIEPQSLSVADSDTPALGDLNGHGQRDGEHERDRDETDPTNAGVSRWLMVQWGQ